MSVKESKSLQFNDIIWKPSHLGEQVILLECARTIPIELIHQSARLIEKILDTNIKDIVPAYHSIAVFTPLSIQELVLELAGKTVSNEVGEKSIEVVKLPICYEYALDLERISARTQLPEEEVINIHLMGTYRSLFMGFTPGFIYADGLDESIACPRLKTPRKRLPAGSVGIAGNQTGLYSLASPGGWNIIGRTPAQVFDPQRTPMMIIDVGASYQFFRITKEEFERWEG